MLQGQVVVFFAGRSQFGVQLASYSTTEGLIGYILIILLTGPILITGPNKVIKLSSLKDLIVFHALGFAFSIHL